MWFSKEAGCGLVRKQGCGLVRKQGCGLVREQGCGLVREQGCGLVREQGCGLVREQGCGLVRKQGCGLAMVHSEMMVTCLGREGRGESRRHTLQGVSVHELAITQIILGNRIYFSKFICKFSMYSVIFQNAYW